MFVMFMMIDFNIEVMVGVMCYLLEVLLYVMEYLFM